MVFWVSFAFAQTIKTISLSDVKTWLRVDGKNTIWNWKEDGEKNILTPTAPSQQMQQAIVFSIKNDLEADTTFYLRAGINSYITLQLFDDSSGRLISQQQTGYNIPIHQQFGQDEEFVLPVFIKKAQTLKTQVLLKGFFGAPASTRCYLYTHEAYLTYLQEEAGYSNTQEFIVIFFVGATLMLLLFFLFMYTQSRQALYGRYAIYLALQWLYGILKLGPATLVGYTILHYPFVQFALVEPVVIAAVGGYVWFVNELLDLKHQKKGLYRLLKWFAFILWAYSIVFGLLSFAIPTMPFRVVVWQSMRIFLLLTNLPLLLYILFKVKSSVKKFFLAGNFLFLAVSVIAGLYTQIPFLSSGYLNRMNTTTWYMLGILLECIFFAFALGLRIKELQQNKQASDEKLIEQMQVNEKLIMETNQQLEQKVAERTEEIRRQAQQLEEVRLQETRAAYEKQLSETRMQALRSRMNPHFIFNSLNSIKYFILKKENDTAEFYLNKFSRLLRLILDYTTHETITLQQELEALSVYLEIESVRFDKSFHYHVHVDEQVDPEKVHIPPLLLQPFVENAIWHGLANSEKDEKYCHIEVSKNNGHVLMQIVDNGVGREEAGRINANKPSRHISHGIRITEDRVTLFNNTNKGILNIEVEDNEDAQQQAAGTTVNITLENP